MSGICPCTLGNSVAGALFNLKKQKEISRQELEPEHSAAATVLSRRVDTVYSLTRSDSSWAYFVRFRLDGGDEIELRVSEAQYGMLQEGLCGNLTWQGSVFLSLSEE